MFYCTYEKASGIFQCGIEQLHFIIFRYDQHIIYTKNLERNLKQDGSQERYIG